MTDQHDKPAGIGRRELLAGAGFAVAATALARPAAAATTTVWDHETDVVCVGSGAAACGAAVTAVGQGAQVIVVEKMPLLGGTTAKSGGVTWISKQPGTARARSRRPQGATASSTSPATPIRSSIRPRHRLLGLPEPQYRLLEAFYDNGSRMVDHMQQPRRHGLQGIQAVPGDTGPRRITPTTCRRTRSRTGARSSRRSAGLVTGRRQSRGPARGVAARPQTSRS